MRNLIIVLVLLTTAIIVCLGQAFNRQVNDIEKYISIADKRSTDIVKIDTSTIGHMLGDVYVERTKLLRSNFETTNDTNASTYFIHFYKLYLNRTTCYSTIHNDSESFDKASYKWLNDTVVAVRLFNSMSGADTKYKLTYSSKSCCSAGMLFN